MRGRRRGAPESDGAREVISRAAGRLRRYQAAGVHVIPVAEALEMLGASPEDSPGPQSPDRLPLADPLTGCLPASAPDVTR